MAPAPGSTPPESADDLSGLPAAETTAAAAPEAEEFEELSHTWGNSRYPWL